MTKFIGPFFLAAHHFVDTNGRRRLYWHLGTRGDLLLGHLSFGASWNGLAHARALAKEKGW